MKTALIIAYILIAILAVVVFMEWKFIQALTPVNTGNGAGTGSSQDTTANPGRSAAASGDGSATFGSMIDAVKEGAKEMELKVTFDK